MTAEEREARDRLDDARRALGCLSDVLVHVPPAPEGDLHCLDPENLAGFLRLVLSQFPTD